MVEVNFMVVSSFYPPEVTYILYHTYVIFLVCLIFGLCFTCCFAFYGKVELLKVTLGNISIVML